MGRKDDWVSLVNASIAWYFRFQDNEAVVRAIRKLAEPLALEGADFASIRNYRRWATGSWPGRASCCGSSEKG